MVVWIRVIYFYVTQPGQVFMASVYAKSDRKNLSAADRRVLTSVSRQIKTEVRRRQQ